MAKSKENKIKNIEEWQNKSSVELKDILQKLVIDIASGKEKNTSLKRKLKKLIAKKLTVKQK